MRSRRSAKAGVFADGAPPVRRTNIDDPMVRSVLGGRVMRIFEYMQIATDVLDAAGFTRTGLAELYQREFFELDPRLYRHHCEELAARMRAGWRLEPGTRAEVLIACMNTSLRGPLNVEWAAVYETLFAEIFPVQFAELGLARPVSEKWKGQVEEFIRDTSHSIARPRTLAAGWRPRTMG